MEHSGNTPTFNIPATFPREYSYIQYSRNIPQGIFPGIHRERFPNIPGIYHGNVPRIFHKHIFALWFLTFINYKIRNLLNASRVDCFLMYLILVLANF